MLKGDILQLKNKLVSGGKGVVELDMIDSGLGSKQAHNSYSYHILWTHF